MDKKTKILICGTPGTGKSSTLKEIKINEALKIGLSEFCIKKKIVKKEEVEISKLQKKLAKEIAEAEEKMVIVEGHLGCELRGIFNTIIVLRCEPKKLEKRLEKRKYSKQKILDNLVSELLDYCTLKSMENNPRSKVIEIRSDRHKSKEIARKIEKMIKLKKFKGEKVSFKLNNYKEYLRRDVL